MASTRRTFLSSLAAAGAALPLAASAGGRNPATKPLKILVLGGTAFLGPHFVRAALAKGHELTLFNRGKTRPELFQDLEQLRGDRDKGELDPLMQWANRERGDKAYRTGLRPDQEKQLLAKWHARRGQPAGK